MKIKIISGGFFDKEIAECQAKLTIENVENGIFPNITGEIKVVKGQPIESYCGEMERWDVVEVLTK
jgi:hypothetical protein